MTKKGAQLKLPEQAARYNFSESDSNTVRLSPLEPAHPVYGYVRNLSSTGLSFRVPRSENLPIKVGQQFNLEMAPLGTKPMSCRCRIVWTESHAEEVWFGAELFQVPPFYRERLEREVDLALVRGENPETEYEVGAPINLYKSLVWLTIFLIVVSIQTAWFLHSMK